ncbi:MAG: zinc ribbon domain-containing protein [Clostridia bacterium]|nr:zinc ribbon domain-containing protein [Clostridia bacterium]
MTHCPKCGQKLHLYNVSQFCPNCKVNLRFCNFEENFYREAKEAELNLARMHVKLRHMKVAFIGSKLAIARLIAVVLPIVAIVLFSAGSLGINLPFFRSTIALKGIDLYNAFNEGSIAYILKMSSSSLAAEQFAAARNILFCYAAAVLFAVFVLVLTILCFISYKNMPKITAVVAGVGAVVSVVMQLVISSLAGSISGGLVISASSSFGLYILAAALAVVAVSNALLIKFKPKVEYEEGDWERYQILLKVKSGEIDFDSLPQPIVETEETRQIEEEIAKGLKHFEDEQGRKEIEEGESAEASEKEPAVTDPSEND